MLLQGCCSPGREACKFDFFTLNEKIQGGIWSDTWTKTTHSINKIKTHSIRMWVEPLNAICGLRLSCWNGVLSGTETGNLRLLSVFSVILIRNEMWCQMCVIWPQGLPRFITTRVGFYGALVTKVNNNTTGWLWSNNVTPFSPHPSPCGVVLSRSLVAAGPGQACGRGEALLCVRMRLEERSLTGAFTHPVTQQFQSCVLVNNPLPPFLLPFPLIPSALVEPCTSLVPSFLPHR